jgi:hypothetical protein
MQPTDIRDQNHAAKCGGHADHRAAVLAALVGGPAPVSTRALAARMGWDVLSVRPRVTELVQAGLVVMDGRDADGGLYRAATMQEIQRAQTRRPDGQPVQTELPFTTTARRRHY